MKSSVLELLKLVGGQTLSHAAQSPLTAKPIEQVHPSPILPKHSVTIKGNGNGHHHAPEAKASSRGTTPAEGDFRDF